MSEIIKTEAIVLTKLDYGETSSIISFFTKEQGRISTILKGGRNPKSKMGLAADPINHLQIIIYQKKNRDIQLLTGADIISHYPNIKGDYEKLKYCYAVLELVKNLLLEEEQNQKIFKGIVRIFELIEEGKEENELLFGRFFLFFLKELGYELQFGKCNSCGKASRQGEVLSYFPEIGILCSECKKGYPETIKVEPELFLLFNCLKNNLAFKTDQKEIFNRAISLMERHLKHHLIDFKGLSSLKLFK